MQTALSQSMIGKQDGINMFLIGEERTRYAVYVARYLRLSTLY